MNYDTTSKGNLDKFFYPNSIAIIGASNDISKIGGFIFSNIIKLNNITPYPINKKNDTVQEIRAYPDISEIDEEIDLAIIVIPRDFVVNSLRECSKKGIKNVIIISAGFKEIGEDGKKREDEIKKILEENNINLIGPNCLGIVNAEIGLNCSFAKDIPPKGDVALVSQSGAVIDAIIDWSFKHNIGFSKIASLGNMAGIDSLEILKYLKDDSKTNTIVFYMETLERGEEFTKLLKEVSRNKKVIIIKPGNSKNAQDAIGSHTGSLAQDNILVKTSIRENNAIFVEDLGELYDMLVASKTKRLPKDETLAILTNAGGPGVITTDFASSSGFNLYKLTDEEKSRFDFLPKEASLNNPIDILGDAKSDRYAKALEELCKIDNISSILVLLTPQVMTDNLEIAKKISEISKKTQKTIYCCFLGGKEIKEAVKYLDMNSISNFETPGSAIFSLKTMLEYNKYNYDDKEKRYKFNEEKIEKIREKIKEKNGLLDFETTKEIMDILKIKLPEKLIIKDLNDINELVLDENKKYVLKVDSKELIHKKDIGGIKLGINKKNYEKEIKDMFSKISKYTNRFTLTLEEEVSGFETIVGLKAEKNLGNFIIFGMGGTFVDLYDDVNISVCPLTRNKTEKLVKSSKAFKALKGFRGTKKIDFEHLYEILIRVSYLQQIFPEIKEADINPLMCSSKGIYLVDVKLII